MANIYCSKEKEHQAAVKRAKENILASEDVENLCKAFRLLGDPTRMKIVLALMKGKMCVYHLAELSDSTVSGVSHQLRILRDAKIVKTQRFARNVEYAIADEHVRKIVNMALKHMACEVEAE